MITGAAQMDGAILVVSAADGPMPQTRDTSCSRVRSACPISSCSSTKSIWWTIPNCWNWSSWKCASCSLTTSSGDDIPFIYGSGLKALNNEDDESVKPINELMDALDSYVPEPEREIDKPFLMAVEDVFTISGRGTVATGRIERGQVKVGEEVEIVGMRDIQRTAVTGLEMFRKSLDVAVAGYNCGALLRGLKREDVERGQVLAKPGSITPHTDFEAEVYILSKEEGGRHTPFFKNYRPQFYFRTTDVTGEVSELGGGAEMVMPGDNIKMTVGLVAPVAMEEGLRFAIREGGRTVGAGVVAKIIK